MQHRCPNHDDDISKHAAGTARGNLTGPEQRLPRSLKNTRAPTLVEHAHKSEFMRCPRQARRQYCGNTNVNETQHYWREWLNTATAFSCTYAADNSDPSDERLINLYTHCEEGLVKCDDKTVQITRPTLFKNNVNYHTLHAKTELVRSTPARW